MVAPDHDRRLDGAGADELVEPVARSGTLAIAEPADPRGQSLEADALLCCFDPPDQRRIVGELFDDRAVGRGDVRGIARQRHPPKRTLALAEQRPDIRRNEARIVECARASAEPRLSPQAVPVVEDLCAAVEEADHRIHMTRHALARATYIAVWIVQPKLGRIFR